MDLGVPEASRRQMLHSRLHRAASPHSVAGSLPVLFFGNLFSAQIATVGINPSDQEYLNRAGCELDGSARRFETLTSLGASSRQMLTAEQCERAITTMQHYFQPGKPIYRWFRALDRVTQAMGYSYAAGEVAHLDLVQEATAPTWTELTRRFPHEAATLLSADLPFLRWRFETFPVRAVICNGRTVFQQVSRLLGVSPDAQMRRGILGRITWYAAHGVAATRAVTILGWNIPLARPTGLGKAGEVELGHDLARILQELEAGAVLL